MRVALVNLGGNQGKTTLAVNLFAAQMPDAKILAVETINAAGNDLGAEVEQLRGAQFSRIYAELVAAENLICDVGSSNIEDFIDGLSKFEDGHDEIDVFVIPVTSAAKEKKEAIKTALLLSNLDVPSHKIQFIFNRVTEGVESEFPEVLNFVKKEKIAMANINCWVPDAEFFSLLAEKKINISQALRDETDYKSLIKQASASGDNRAFDKAMDMLAITKQAKKIDAQLNNVFALLVEQTRV